MKKLLSLLLAVLLLSGCSATYDGPTVEKTVPVEFIREDNQITTGHADNERTVYAYDIYGNMVRSVEYHNGKESSRTDFTYDQRGNLLSRTSYSLGGWFSRRTGSVEFEYDEQDRIIAEIYEENRYVWELSLPQLKNRIYPGTMSSKLINQILSDRTSRVASTRTGADF